MKYYITNGLFFYYKHKAIFIFIFPYFHIFHIYVYYNSSESWNSLNLVIYRTDNWLVVSGVINTEMYCINCKEIVNYFLPNLLKSLFHSPLWYFNISNRFALFTKFLTSRNKCRWNAYLYEPFSSFPDVQSVEPSLACSVTPCIS